MKLPTANEAFRISEESIFQSELESIRLRIEGAILANNKFFDVGKDLISEKAKQLLIQNGYTIKADFKDRPDMIIISWDKPKRSLKESVEFTVETISDEINALIIYSDELEKEGKDNRCEQAKIKAFHKAIDIVTENIKY